MIGSAGDLRQSRSEADGFGRDVEGIRRKIKVLQQKQIFFEMEDQVLELEKKIEKIYGVGSPRPPALPGFLFDVRLPLPSKDGLLLEKLPNGTFRKVHAKVDWPRFDMIDANSGSPIEGGTWMIQNSVVRPRPHLDGKTGNGSMGCALQLEPRDGSKVATFFAKTPSERDEWCRVLRKHAVHHDLGNGFKLTRKVLGTGACEPEWENCMSAVSLTQC